MIALTGQDILDAVGLPPASPEDSAWADTCAAATNAFVNSLPIATDVLAEEQVLAGGMMLGAALYRRRPAGLLSGDADPMAAAAVDGTISRLLRLGYYQAPVIA